MFTNFCKERTFFDRRKFKQKSEALSGAKKRVLMNSTVSLEVIGGGWEEQA
jgi:hypothetical protein